jgi:aconitase A
VRTVSLTRPRCRPAATESDLGYALSLSRLWFADKADYAKISAGDSVETVGVAGLLAGDYSAPIVLRVTKPNGSVIEVPTKHTMSVDQVGWLKAGSALNLVREKKAAAAEPRA